MGYTLCVLGCGTMGVAILSGALASLDSSPLTSSHQKWETHSPGAPAPVQNSDPSLPSRFFACVNREESVTNLQSLLRSIGERGQAVQVLAKQNVHALNRSDVIILSCKPQLARTILCEEGMQQALDGKLLISILAGVTISQLQALVPPSTRIIRAMPNIACKIREGMTVISTIPPSPDAELDCSIILSIFSSVGRCRISDEKQFDACTALSGVGPAFACLFLEAMADGGVMLGLSRPEALELAAEGLQGAAKMSLQPGAHPAQIRDSVATPGGCTIAGLLSLEDGKVRSTVARALQVAAERASQLGQSTSPK